MPRRDLRQSVGPGVSLPLHWVQTFKRLNPVQNVWNDWNYWNCWNSWNGSSFVKVTAIR
jgi:hypothetical protein